VNPWLGMALVLGTLALCFAALALWPHKVKPHPELSRKLMHVLMGLVAASFPWLFDSAWPVLVLAGASMAALWVVRSGRVSAARLHSVLHDVERASWGELMFPLGVAAVFVLANGDALLYSVPILILALADAVAALIGLRYGQMRFNTLDGSKSLEGSFAFFLVSLLCVHIALLLFTDTGRAESLLIGLILGLLVMMSEAVAWRGLDNLFIPLASYALLKAYLELDAAALLTQLGVVVFLLLFVITWRRRSSFDDSALIGAVLLSYTVWVIGGLAWLTLMLLSFMTATVLALRHVAGIQRNLHNLPALLALCAPGLFWLLMREPDKDTAAFFAFALSFGAHVAMFGVSRIHAGQTHLAWAHLLPALIQSWSVLAVSWLLFMPWQTALSTLLPALLLLGAATYAFYRWQPNLIDCPRDSARWWRQAALAALASGAGWLWMQALG